MHRKSGREKQHEKGDRRRSKPRSPDDRGHCAQLESAACATGFFLQSSLPYEASCSFRTDALSLQFSQFFVGVRSRTPRTRKRKKRANNRRNAAPQHSVKREVEQQYAGRKKRLASRACNVRRGHHAGSKSRIDSREQRNAKAAAHVGIDARPETPVRLSASPLPSGMRR